MGLLRVSVSIGMRYIWPSCLFVSVLFHFIDPTCVNQSGGIALTGYVLTLVPSSGANLTATATSSPYRFQGLKPSTTYTCYISAENAIGAGASLAMTVSTVNGTVPTAPLTLAVDSFAFQSVNLKWAAPASVGGWPVLSYTLYAARADGTGTETSTPSTLLVGVASNLDSGVAYSFTVTATNEVGEGPRSAAVTQTTSTNAVNGIAQWINDNPAIFYGALGGLAGLVILIVVVAVVADKRKEKRKRQATEMRQRTTAGDATDARRVSRQEPAGNPAGSHRMSQSHAQPYDRRDAQPPSYELPSSSNPYFA